MGRRISKKVSTRPDVSSPFTLQTSQLFLYDGWNLIQELTQSDVSNPNSSFEIERSYTWGLDLSQTLQGAGGVGGLLSVLDINETKQYYYTYDANGNVSQLVYNAGNIVAHYEYSPFGITTVKSGDYADVNPFRFSTKYSSLVDGTEANERYYYVLRYYNLAQGKWLTRDPISDKRRI